MKPEKLYILGPRRGDEATEKWKKETEKLYFDHIFPHLKWNDLLRFRRVCKAIKELADKYIKTKGGPLCPEITIYETGTNKDKCLARFLELGFPATSIYIMNTSGIAMFEKEAKYFAKFLKKSGPGSKITQVRIHQLNNMHLGKENAFFEGLPNLKSLLVDMFGGVTSTNSSEEIMRMAKQTKAGKGYPERFKQLKKVTIGLVPNFINVDVTLASRFLTGDCMELEYCADAFSSFTKHTAPPNIMVGLKLVFNDIQNYIEHRAEKYSTKPNLKYYDFTSFNKCPAARKENVEFVNSLEFLDLLISCVKHSVKLLNVNSAWFQQWQRLKLIGAFARGFPKNQSESHTLSLPVVSMVNLHGLAIPMAMPYLEKLIIPATSRCSLVPKIWREDRQPWPALQVLDVTVDSKMLQGVIVDHDDSTSKSICMDPETTTSLMKFLFVGIQREAVRELSLAFVEGVDVDDVTVKAATCLGVSCSNMKKLTLVNWPGSNATFIKVLRDVKALEELCLDNCKKIGDLAFTKIDTTDGLIQQHSGLKKLSLKQLDKMPKLTDKLFQDVLSRLKLSHLLLSSNVPLTNITPDGITALKDGEFVKSIEKFPFTGWSLANFSEKSFREMEKEFRSFNMI